METKEGELSEQILKIMMTIPNIIDPSVPIGKMTSENVEVERFGELCSGFEIPYHTEIMERFNGNRSGRCKKGWPVMGSIISWVTLQGCTPL